MAIVVRFVDDRGCVVERFVGIVHVKETSAISLKNALKNFLCGYKLPMSRIRGQGYDGASNMRGRLGGLKTLIQQDNPNANYIHCFAHQLQLALIAVVKEHSDAKWFLGVVTRVVNVIASSNKRQDLLRDHQATHIAKLIEGGLLETGRGLNQERSLEFSDVDDQTLTKQFECYIKSVRGDDRFFNLKGLGQLCRALVETKKHKCYNYVFELLKLALILPVATTSVERFEK